MPKSTLTSIMIVLGFATALIHFFLNIRLGRFDPVFTLNGFGYLALVAANAGWLPLAWLKGREGLLNWAFIGYCALTIFLWIIMGSTSDSLAVIDKLIELALIVVLFMRGRAS